MLTFQQRGDGMRRARHSLSSLPSRTGNAGAKGLYRSGHLVMAKSAIEVPVRSGALRATGYVTLPKKSGSRYTVTLGYGGVPGAQGVTIPTSQPRTSKKGNVYQSSAGVDYALYVHENLEAHHLPPTKAKFLEGPAIEIGKPAIPVEVKLEIDKELALMATEGHA